MNQKGFATLEIILMIMVIGILATMAVPQFEKITAQANTAKVQTDLATINTAIAVYQMEKGTTPEYKDLTADYFENGRPQEPTGKIYHQGEVKETTTVGKGGYGVNSGKATFMGKPAEEFTTKSKPAEESTTKSP